VNFETKKVLRKEHEIKSKKTGGKEAKNKPKDNLKKPRPFFNEASRNFYEASRNFLNAKSSILSKKPPDIFPHVGKEELTSKLQVQRRPLHHPHHTRHKYCASTPRILPVSPQTP
jgi:hypothetical protein